METAIRFDAQTFDRPDGWLYLDFARYSAGVRPAVA
jgi:hypothetical protein